MKNLHCNDEIFSFSDDDNIWHFYFLKNTHLMNAQVKFYEDKLAYELDPSDLFEAMNNASKVVPVDMRKPEGFNREHIPGALNIPHRSIAKETTKMLRKDVLYVAYCDGIGCNASTKGALKLASLGFQVMELIGGIEWWKRDGYDTEGTQGVETGLKVRCFC
jgi:rhodanese-related sulfurtransferase